MKRGRDDFPPPLKKGYEKWGMGRLTGEKVLVVKYSFLISEKTLVRKAGMKRWEGEWNETFLCWSCAQREEQPRPFVWTTKTAFVVGHSNKGTGGICVKNRAPASEGTCEARLGFNAASQFNKTPLISDRTDGNLLVFPWEADKMQGVDMALNQVWVNYVWPSNLALWTKINFLNSQSALK